MQALSTVGPVSLVHTISRYAASCTLPLIVTAMVFPPELPPSDNARTRKEKTMEAIRIENPFRFLFALFVTNVLTRQR